MASKSQKFRKLQRRRHHNHVAAQKNRLRGQRAQVVVVDEPPVSVEQEADVMFSIEPHNLRVHLNSLTVDQLRDQARGLVPGFSKMKKADLVDALLKVGR